MSRDDLLIVGSGRWARVVAHAAMNGLAAIGRVVFLSPSNAAGLSQWASQAGLSPRVHAVTKWRDVDPGRIRFCVVANAAREHAGTARSALEAGIATLVEKPLVLSSADLVELIALADRQQLRLGASNVFLFARYLHRFAGILANTRPIGARLTWQDATGEIRYGERKAFDPTISVMTDVLPHALAILQVILAEQQFAIGGLSLDRGGATVRISLAMGTGRGEIILSRNASRRVRHIEVDDGASTLSLDFPEEPAKIKYDDGRVEEIPGSDGVSTPLVQMLRSFESSLNGPLDDRLTPARMAPAYRLIDEARERYWSAQSDWLCHHLTGATPEGDDDIRYFLRETAHLCGATSQIDEAKITIACRQLDRENHDVLIKRLRNDSRAALMHVVRDIR